MKKTKTVQSLAKELSRAFVHDNRNDGQRFAKLAEGSPEWMTDVIRSIHSDKMPDDTTYEFIERCADAIADYGIAGEDSANDAVNEIEPDPYTNDLTAWLHARVDHVYYLTEVLEEFGDIKDGFQLLAMAQQKQIQEIGYSLISELEKLAEVTDARN